jgi:dihydrofolate reductase
MGRKTFDSIGKPLPNRVNIVITRNTELQIPGCEVVNSVDEALQLAVDMRADEQQIYIIGGENIYTQTLDLVSTIYYTKVYASPQGDAFFPVLTDIWKAAERVSTKANEKNEYDFEVIKYVRQ